MYFEIRRETSSTPQAITAGIPGLRRSTSNILTRERPVRLIGIRSSRAMRDALENALIRFGIAGPSSDKIKNDTEASIEATRQQCILNADKYVSNETYSSTDWEAGKSVGGITARAYAAVPAPTGGMQQIVARENTWPASDVATLGQYRGDGVDRPASGDSTRDLGDDGFGNENSLSPGVSGDPYPSAGPARETSGAIGSMPQRYLGRRIAGQPEASKSPAVSFVPSSEVSWSGHPPSFDYRFGKLDRVPAD